MSEKQISTVEAYHLEASNAVQLSARQWSALGAFALAMGLLVPALWPRVEKFEYEPDYRIPYDLSNDYWLFDRSARLAAAQCDTLIVGDSVIWGQYVKRQQTLSHYLNERAGRERFANLGLDGMHPAALAGLIEHYGGGITGKNVVLFCNPLWMSSPKHDLQEKEEFRFNHPELVPQFAPKIPCYKEKASKRIGNAIDRNVPFDGWVNHLQQAYFERSDIPNWTVEHPYANPIAAITLRLPPSDNQLRHNPVPWTKSGIRKQDFAWVDLNTSFQWRSFRHAVETLQRRNNRVFVLVGPFNEHLLTEKGNDGYQRLKRDIVRWLDENKIPYGAPAALPSELYADASHPLGAGYELLAQRLFESDFFKAARDK